MDKDFVYRKKKGFSIPMEKWFSKGAALQQLFNDQLLSSDSRVLFYFDKEILKSMLQNKNYKQLWLILFLEMWMKENEKKNKINY
jgi:hypothetical protein